MLAISSKLDLRVQFLLINTLFTPTRCPDTPNTIGMDLKSLSGNWKRLQETLKKKDSVSASTSTKRKTSEREPQNGVVKKRKREATDEIKKPDRRRASTKRKRMSESDGSKGDSDVQSTSRRSSTSAVVAQARAELKNGKVNEGRSPRLALLHSFPTVLSLHMCSTFSNAQAVRN